MKITDEGFIAIDITDEMMTRAQAKADEMGQLRNSIRRGRGNLAGFLGEEVVLQAWNGAESQNTYQFDVTFEGVSFEVKTKDRTVPPRIDYETSVANFNPNQRADFYAFVSLYRPNKEDPTGYVRGYVLGIISKADYQAQARFLKKGEIDPSNNYEVKADCYNLGFSKLSRFEGW